MISNLRLFDTPCGKLWLAPAASTMQALMVEARWEWRKIDYMRQHLKSGMVFADVGAFNGYFSLLASQLVGSTGTVFAFEPDTRCMVQFENNIEANQFPKNITPLLAAVGAYDGTVSMYRGAQDGFTSTRRQSDITFSSKQVRIDSAISPCLDMMKIDVEGSELNVLRGAEITLFASKHMHLLLDLHPELGVTPEGIEDFLLAHDFKLYSIRDEFMPIPRIPSDLVELLAVK